jgi:hypothetical protein
MNSNFLEDFRRCYATAIHNICHTWKCDEDSSNNYYQTRVRQVEPFETLSLIYQPGAVNRDGFVEVGHVLVSVKKGVAVGKAEKSEMRKITSELHKMVLEDYHLLRHAANGRWFCELPDDPNAENILQLITPMKMIKSNIWKFSFRLNSDIDGRGSRGWIPKSVSTSVGLFDELCFENVVETMNT